MTTNPVDRMDRIETAIENLVDANIASLERMALLEEVRESDRQESNERLTRIEQIVESNNRFLESFSRSVQTFSDTVTNLAQTQNGIIATSNSDRQESNIQLGRIQRKVDAIAQHLGLDE